MKNIMLLNIVTVIQETKFQIPEHFNSIVHSLFNQEFQKYVELFMTWIQRECKIFSMIVNLVFFYLFMLNLNWDYDML